MRPTSPDPGLSVFCVLPRPFCCPALSNPVLTGELLKTAIGYIVLLPNNQIVHAIYPINHFLCHQMLRMQCTAANLFGIKIYISYLSPLLP